MPGGFSLEEAEAQIMSRVIEGVVPPAHAKSPFRGWSYPQDLADDIWITGTDYNDLVRQVTQFRIANNVPMGNPEGDIERYYCKYFPRSCHELAPNISVAEDAQPSPLRTFQERIDNWIRIRYALLETPDPTQRLDYADPLESERRAAICVQCPANARWHSSCAPCNVKTEQYSVIVRKNLKTSVDDRLFGCAAAEHDNRTAVHLAPKHLAHRKRYKLPKICWMKNL